MGKLAEVARAVAINFAIAAGVAILIFGFSEGGIRQYLVYFYHSAVYSNCVGGLAFVVIPRQWRATVGMPAMLRWPLRVLTILAVSAAGTLLAGFVIQWLLNPRHDPVAGFGRAFIVSAVVALTFGLAIAFYHSMRHQLEEKTLELRTRELERERALKMTTEAQLAALESRVHPHFLFNALNSISSLIPEDPRRAEQLIGRMAALLRFSLDANQSGLVPLEREMKIAADYLEIEKARFGDRLRYRIDVPAELSQTLVPPLSVQTVVENAVKYAVAPRREGGRIEVTGRAERGAVEIEIADDGPGFSSAALKPGHGLDLLQQRMEAGFGRRAALTLGAHAGGMKVTIAVPAHAGAEAGHADSLRG
ncbi:MAG: histidine kinase [Bryobacteraceae bacterium]|nr:histidine kinase [Bryobacteraceae bacterium]